MRGPPANDVYCISYYPQGGAHWSIAMIESRDRIVRGVQKDDRKVLIEPTRNSRKKRDAAKLALTQAKRIAASRRRYGSQAAGIE